jgi:oxepin-CoA hydrolase/3-oxo-5,6-dehydrosuberyl-CoA semialdehyde dehydrogenase
MKVRFDVNDPGLREAFLRTLLRDAIASLQPQDPPRWGRMTAQQMLEHLAWSFELSTGRAQVDCPIPEEKRERMKAFLYHNRPTPPDFMNPALEEGLPALQYAGLPEAAAALGREVDRFLEQAGSQAGAVHTHPVFGPLGVEEWSRSHFKHGCHHLLQFGLVEVEG